MKKTSKRNSKPTPDAIGIGPVEDTRLVTAGYVDFTNNPAPVPAEKRAYLVLLDKRLRAKQTRMDRLLLYRDIIQRGDLGNGWALGFTDDFQGQEYNCEELAVMMDALEKAKNIKETIIETIRENKLTAADVPLLTTRQAAAFPPKCNLRTIQDAMNAGCFTTTTTAPGSSRKFILQDAKFLKWKETFVTRYKLKKGGKKP